MTSNTNNPESKLVRDKQGNVLSSDEPKSTFRLALIYLLITCAVVAAGVGIAVYTSNVYLGIGFVAAVVTAYMALL